MFWTIVIFYTHTYTQKTFLVLVHFSYRLAFSSHVFFHSARKKSFDISCGEDLLRQIPVALLYLKMSLFPSHLWRKLSLYVELQVNICTSKIPFHCLLFCIVSLKKSVIMYFTTSLYMKHVLSLTEFKIFTFLSSVFSS